MRRSKGLSRRICFIFVLVVAATTYHAAAIAAQLTLTWTDNSTNEDGFKVERKTDTAGTYAQVAKVGANVTSYTDASLASGTTYCYRVRAFNATQDSTLSNETCNTTAAPRV